MNEISKRLLQPDKPPLYLHGFYMPYTADLIMINLRAIKIMGTQKEEAGSTEIGLAWKSEFSALSTSVCAFHSYFSFFFGEPIVTNFVIFNFSI